MSPDVLRIFIGFDAREPVAFSVLASSILRRASRPVAIVPLERKSLAHIHTRQRGPTESTDFAFTRFLVPYLSDYKGQSIFMDCDMVCRADIGDVLLHQLADPGRAVYVSQHDYVPRTRTKFLGQPQTAYPRKNWSSFMLFNNSRCQKLTPEYVNTASGLDLHRFHWLRGGVVPGVEMITTLPGDPHTWVEDDENDYIGSLPLDWNWLVGEYDPNPHANVLHYTLGTPCFSDYADCDQADVWWDEYREMLKPARAVERALAGTTA